MRSESKTSLLLVALVALVAVPAFALNVIEDHQDIEGPFTDGPSVTRACSMVTAKASRSPRFRTIVAVA